MRAISSQPNLNSHPTFFFVLSIPPLVRTNCLVMLVAQILVVLALWSWGRPYHAIGIAALILGQVMAMPRFLADPGREAIRYNATGTGLFVLGMMVAAFALRSIGGAA